MIDILLYTAVACASVSLPGLVAIACLPITPQESDCESRHPMD